MDHVSDIHHGGVPSDTPNLITGELVRISQILMVPSILEDMNILEFKWVLLVAPLLDFGLSIDSTTFLVSSSNCSSFLFASVISSSLSLSPNNESISSFELTKFSPDLLFNFSFFCISSSFSSSSSETTNVTSLNPSGLNSIFDI